MKFFSSVQLILLFFSIKCFAVKILVYSPVFGKSHLMFMGRLADLYVKAGHEVVVFQPVIIDADPDLKLTGTQFARVIQRPRDFNHSFDTVTLQSRAWRVDNKNFVQALQGMTQIGLAFSESCRHALNDDEMMQKLRNEKFDIAIGQFNDQCFFAVTQVVGIKRYIVASSSPLPSFIGRRMGLMLSTSYVPDFYKPPPIKMTMVERAVNLFGALGAEWIFGWWLTLSTRDAILEKLPNYDDTEALNGAAYVFVNTDEYVEFPQPITHKMINIGGFGQEVVEPLDKKFKQLLDESKRGVVIISFGTIARSFTMPDELKKAFLDAFAKFKDVTFIWKYEKDEDNVAKDYPNVRTFKWLPQAALLNHPKTLGLVTHGGMNSVTESVKFGIPMVCIALFADQTRNARMVTERGIGTSLEKYDLTVETISGALDKIINDKSYYNKAKAISQLVNEKPETADQRILKYTEFAARFDLAERLHLRGADFSAIQFYNLDVIFLFILSIVLLIGTFVWLCKKLVCCLFCRKRNAGNAKVTKVD